MPQKFDNLAALDWDDTALIKAYQDGLDELEGKRRASKQSSKKKNEWKVGDFCSTVYYGDGLPYEAKIIEISGDTCVVEFLGYDEQVDVDTNALSKSLGKKARKKQQKAAHMTVVSDESLSIDVRNECIISPSPLNLHSKKKHHRNHMTDHFGYNPAAEHTFHGFPGSNPLAHCNEAPLTSMLPPAPPMPQCSEVAQNPSLCAMLTSWYMAGYYTGLHQAQKNKCHQHSCCRPAQNFCHHSY